MLIPLVFEAESRLMRLLPKLLRLGNPIIGTPAEAADRTALLQVVDFYETAAADYPAPTGAGPFDPRPFCVSPS